jgi:hypothetical protein
MCHDKFHSAKLTLENFTCGKKISVPPPASKKQFFLGCICIKHVHEHTELFIVQNIFREKVGKFTPFTIGKTISMAIQYGFEMFQLFII